MKTTGVFALLFAIALVLCTATVEATKEDKYCYYKKQYCCYKYEKCGEKERKYKKVYKCPKKYCTKVCKCGRECKKVRDGHKYVCYPKYYKARVCEKKHYFYYYFDKKADHGVRCHYVTKQRKVCEYRPKYREVCEKKCQCYPQCYYKPYYCVRYDVYKFPKFCPKEHCYEPKDMDKPKKPEVYYGKKVFVKKTEEKKFIHHPKW